ncbi:MAG: YCF48-related protein [Ignavibacteriales bacterium]|nr:YCF48-related protein [Ignavibacteriales bacterium]
MNSGSNWNIVYSNISSALDSINWIIPNTPSQQCLIRISDVNNNLYSDTSNTAFMISSGGWAAQNSGTTNFLYSINFLNDNFGFCVGNDGIILKTTNGGDNWSLMFYDPDLWLLSVYIINEQNGVAVGNYGLILMTTDSGENWNQIVPITSEKLNAIQFVNDNIGWILADDGAILNTTDGGLNWNLSQHTQNVDWVLAIVFRPFVRLDSGQIWHNQQDN